MATGGIAVAQDHADHVAAPAQIARTVMWSDASAWPGGKVPAAGDAVVIPRDTEVVLDVSPPALRSLTVNGRLRFADERDLELVTEWIYLPGGELAIGSEAAPFRHNAAITLTDEVTGENINTMGDRGIMLMGGTLNLHGDRTHTWTSWRTPPSAAARGSKCSTPPAGARAPRSCLPRPTSIRARPSGARSPRSPATR